MQKILLASSSVYRRQLLDKLGIAYCHESPEINEKPLPDEGPTELVQRLALNKTLALAEHYPGTLIIGADQVAVLDGQILGKPGAFAKAKSQLAMASGKHVTFFTGLCLLNTTNFRTQIRCETYSVFFRSLTSNQIDQYLQREQPYDCAGSFKSEGLGISLFRKLEGHDPNTLIGLPLIALIDMLINEGIDVLA